MGQQRGGRLGGTGRVTARVARCSPQDVDRGALANPDPESVRLEVGRVRKKNWQVKAGLEQIPFSLNHILRGGSS